MHIHTDVFGRETGASIPPRQSALSQYQQNVGITSRYCITANQRTEENHSFDFGVLAFQDLDCRLTRRIASDRSSQKPFTEDDELFCVRNGTMCFSTCVVLEWRPFRVRVRIPSGNVMLVQFLGSIYEFRLNRVGIR